MALQNKTAARWHGSAVIDRVSDPGTQTDDSADDASVNPSGPRTEIARETAYGQLSEARTEIARETAYDFGARDIADPEDMAREIDRALERYEYQIERRVRAHIERQVRAEVEIDDELRIERRARDRELLRAFRQRMGRADATWEAELARAYDDVEAALKASAKKVPRPFFISGTDLLARSYPPTPWLVRGLLKDGGLGVVGAEAKAGKTWILTEMAMAVATGTPAFREFTTGPARRVAYFYAEDGGGDVQAHLRALAAGRNMDPARAVANIHTEPFDGESLDLTDLTDVARLVASCRRIGPIDMLCIDPLRNVHSAEEDDSGEMIAIMKRLKVIGHLLGCTVVVPHHDKKGGSGRGGQKMRGSGAIHGAVDSGLYLSGVECDQDGAVTTIANKVESEIKGARSGGKFGLALTLVDDEHDRAKLATWRVTRERAKTAEESKRELDAGDDAAVLAKVAKLVSAGTPATKSDLRDMIPGLSQQRARAAIARLIPSRLRIVDRKVVLASG